MFELVTWLRDIIYHNVQQKKRHTKKQKQCGRLSLPSIYRDSCCSIREDRRYALLLVLVVVVDIKDWRGVESDAIKGAPIAIEQRKKAHTHTRAKSSPLGYFSPLAANG